MEIRITYVFKLENGTIGYHCGDMPTGMEILEERPVLFPADGYDLKRKSDGEILSCIWLQNGDVQENYEEVEHREPTEE